jgi:HipA-like C-terminal domain
MATSPSADVPHEIERALRGGRSSAATLVTTLGISQPTLSRAIRELGQKVTSFRVSGERTPQYALLRQLPLGVDPRQRVYRYLSNGKVEPFAELEFLAGGATLERIGGAKATTRVYDGLPPYMVFAAPSGFLGRQLANEAARSLQFPESLKDWGDDHMVAYLFTRGLNLPGNLIFGDTCLQAEIEFRAAEPTPVAEKLDHFVAMASALKSASYGSSAGGEQPKFLGLTEDSGHVIVKFAKLGSRMAELLPLEHLALRTLGELGVPASRTQLLVGGEYVFLEVQRFDRKGLTGRIGMLSAGSVDDEYFGQRGSWPEFAARCVQARYLKAQDAFWVDTMAAFSELIGNGDRHFENISMLIGEDGEYLGIAPAYDILPMRYASIGGGVDPDLTPIVPKIGTIGAKPDVWGLAANLAKRFWAAAQFEDFAAPLSPAMRELAGKNLAVAMAFVEPLVPSA